MKVICTKSYDFENKFIKDHYYEYIHGKNIHYIKDENNVYCSITNGLFVEEHFITPTELRKQKLQKIFLSE